MYDGCAGEEADERLDDDDHEWTNGGASGYGGDYEWTSDTQHATVDHGGGRDELEGQARSAQQEQVGDDNRLRAYAARRKVAIKDRASLQDNLKPGMIVDITCPDEHNLEKFDLCEGVVARHIGGETLLKLDYEQGEGVWFPSACCLFCPWRSYEDSDDDGLSDAGEDDEVLAQYTHQDDLSASVALLALASLPTSPASADPPASAALPVSAASLASADPPASAALPASPASLASEYTHQDDLSASVALLASAALPASADPGALLVSAATLASAVLVTPLLVVTGRSLCADFASLAGTPATLGAAIPGAASFSWRLEVLEKELLGAATSGGILLRLVALEVVWLGEAQAGLPRVRLAALESELGPSALRLEALEQAFVSAATAGGMVPRLADLEAAWLQEASAGAVRVRFAALESELGMPSSASDAALAPPTSPPLAPPAAIVSPNDVSLFPASPADAFLGLAAGSSSKSPGAPTPGNCNPSPSARGDFSTLSDPIGNYFDSMIAASEKPFVRPKPEACPPALSGSPGNPSPSASGDFSTLSDPIGNYFDSMIAASEKPSVLPKLEMPQALPPALSGSPSATCGPSQFLGTAVSSKAASAPRSTSKKKKKKIGRKKEGEMANSKPELPNNINGKDPTVSRWCRRTCPKWGAHTKVFGGLPGR